MPCPPSTSLPNTCPPALHCLRCFCLQGAKQHLGVPQYLQPHLLVAGGLQAVDGLLPGFADEVSRSAAAGLQRQRESLHRCIATRCTLEGCSATAELFIH